VEVLLFASTLTLCPIQKTTSTLVLSLVTTTKHQTARFTTKRPRLDPTYPRPPLGAGMGLAPTVYYSAQTFQKRTKTERLLRVRNVG